jgi:hypothetical protein
MNFPEFVKGMKEHFGITNGVNEFLSPTEYVFRRMPRMSITKFDDWLHEKHGEYEEERGMSMKEIIEAEYGPQATLFIKEALGI